MLGHVIIAHLIFGGGEDTRIFSSILFTFILARKALILPGHTDVNHMSAWFQKRALDPLELELQPVASHHVGTGNEPVSSGRAACPLAH